MAREYAASVVDLKPAAIEWVAEEEVAVDSPNAKEANPSVVAERPMEND